jgi:hypothetical protein
MCDGLSVFQHSEYMIRTAYLENDEYGMGTWEF